MIYVHVPATIRHVYGQDGLPLYWKWCEQNFGPPTNSQYGKPATEHYWGLNHGYFLFFADPAHATMFALKWL